MSCPNPVSTDSNTADGFTLDELDQFGSMATLPFPLDHDIWKDRRNLPQILAAIDEATTHIDYRAATRGLF